MVDEDRLIEQGKPMPLADNVSGFKIEVSIEKETDNGQRVVQVKKKYVDPGFSGYKEEKVGEPIVIEEGERKDISIVGDMGISLGTVNGKGGFAGVRPEVTDLDVVAEENVVTEHPY